MHKDAKPSTKLKALEIRAEIHKEKLEEIRFKIDRLKRECAK